MRPRQNQPESTPCGRFRSTPVERQATAFINGWRATRFTSPLPPGVLARLLARKNRLLRLKTKVLPGQRLFHLSNTQEFPGLSFGLSNRYGTGDRWCWRPLTARRE